jgi:hypothetical protein
MCFDLRCYLNNLPQELRHFSVGSAVASVRALCPISQTDFKGLHLRSVQRTISSWNPCRFLNCIAGLLKKINKQGKPAVGAAGAGCRLTRAACKTDALLIHAANQFAA